VVERTSTSLGRPSVWRSFCRSWIVACQNPPRPSECARRSMFITAADALWMLAYDPSEKRVL
jgi:hypothetical protein